MWHWGQESYSYVLRTVEFELHKFGAESHHRDNEIRADTNGFAHPAGKDKHAGLLLRTPGGRFPSDVAVDVKRHGRDGIYGRVGHSVPGLRWANGSATEPTTLILAKPRAHAGKGPRRQFAPFHERKSLLDKMVGGGFAEPTAAIHDNPQCSFS